MALNPFGIASATIDGVTVDVVGDLNYSTSSTTRETVAGQSSVQGYKEMPKAGHIAFTMRAGSGFSITELNNLSLATVVVILNRGVSVSGAGMWQVGDLEEATEEGTIAVRFEGPRVQEI
jgi:hypothetical protein